ncbi:unnamed protein product [Rotaria sp. Silwood2]|nr:unnamed protein product [Rotaria sp. Silwood2]CAF2603452.1 unnamed protein product [Rotaria sp. Silwood2]CAF2820573.1 unnamed protein product [Rotaria sp. Silwood2]CAF2973672.1 unnamed protein product [Rotaria sp. Silwood2]CAF3904173.1 unnamed protein product [Rotaria sp. Silwood2]
MASLTQIVCIIGLALVSFVIYTQQETAIPSSDEQFQLDKRRIDPNVRTSIPLFRGSNLGIFVRKRPFYVVPEHFIVRRKEPHSTSASGEDIWAEVLNNNGQYQRRFDDYSENPGPMFG